VVRAAFAWNLVVEIARLGGSATLLAPEDAATSPLWPTPGPGPLGADVALAPVQSLSDLHHAALDLAVTRAADAADAGLVLVRVPPAWLRGGGEARALLRWVLLFATPEEHDLHDASGLAHDVLAGSEQARVGVTIHGARRVAEAERAFAQVAQPCEQRLGRPLWSYGLLVDDLHVYRAIVSRRPIGIEHPQSRAARALCDVARLVLDDARGLAGG
jgi:hypothetical protein